MKTNVEKIYEVIEERLEQLDHRLDTSGIIDTASLPAVTYYPHPEKGIQNAEGDIKQDRIDDSPRMHLFLIVEGQLRVDKVDEAHREIERFYVDLRDVIFDFSDPHLGGLLYDPMQQEERHVTLPGGQDNVGIVQITLKLPHLEEY